MGQLIGGMFVGLLFGAIAQAYGKRKGQGNLGNMALAVCTIATTICSLFTYPHFIGLLTMTGFIVAISMRK
jgi:uncharacterized membrane protein YeaQ/YmgE (transglycosylase-associated protein family)